MKKGLFTVFIISLFTQVVTGQTIKTGVLVIGNGSNAIGAGFQSAVSGVKTLMLIQEAGFSVSDPDSMINSGLEAEFLKRMRVAKGIKDSTSKVYLDATSSNAVLKSWADSLKNLTVIRNIKWSRIKRSGNNWNVLLADGRTIKAEVMVNADGTGKVSEALDLSDAAINLWRPFSYKDNLYRLSVSSGYKINNTLANIIPLNNFLIPKQENLIVLERKNERMAAGQAGGATAAYAVFFRTKTSLSALKPIQKELINYKLAVIPFIDVDYQDPNWKAVQWIGLTGFLKANFVGDKAHFMPERSVTTAEIRAPLEAYYYKAQIWFDDFKEENMTLGATISMICVVGNKAQENTRAEIKKNWTTVFRFKGDFDLNRAITRREFAVLVEAYLEPFKVNLDKTGRVIR